MKKLSISTIKKVLQAQGYKLYCDEDVLATIPPAIGEKVEFFKVGKYISDDELEKEYASRGLVPAGPLDIAAVSADILKDDVGTHWKDFNGKWCHAAFARGGGERGVGVGRDGNGWCGSWWFAGVRKTLGTSDPKPLTLGHSALCPHCGREISLNKI